MTWQPSIGAQLGALLRDMPGLGADRADFAAWLLRKADLLTRISEEDPDPQMQIQARGLAEVARRQARRLAHMATNTTDPADTGSDTEPRSSDAGGGEG
ncbi:hypothetical protein [Actinopolymorpha pittospori]|uniref:Uncharacterized protein n=1 Tax=Actinopolymorpha pittospori TaxID=648752 RepID=A0A927RPE9_9ACTN|nr:hypothetical protein [Actinopolymorpha pittospori]MBE1612061.1 hypothetical protein [Actinopolymorpha pittospori]